MKRWTNNSREKGDSFLVPAVGDIFEGFYVNSEKQLLVSFFINQDFT